MYKRQGHDWREAVEDVSWETGDLLLLGSGAAGPTAQVFLGSVAYKIVRHAPVPVMIVRRSERVDAVDTAPEADLQEPSDTRP